MSRGDRAALNLVDHERVERRMVARYVRAGDRAIEGGAGIGAVTRVLLDAGAHVIAYEPNPDLLPTLTALSEAYPSGQCQVHSKALTLATGEIALHVYDPWWASRTTALGGCVPAFTRRVPCVAFHEAVTSAATSLMLDVEGEEHAMLRLPIAESVRWIVAELHGESRQLAETLVSMQIGWRLDALEPSGANLVCGWRRHGV